MSLLSPRLLLAALALFAALGAFTCHFTTQKPAEQSASYCYEVTLGFYPYPHASVDVDEILFYVRGEFIAETLVPPKTSMRLRSGS